MARSSQTLRKNLLAIHRWGGLVAGVVLLVIALTGVLMVYEKDIDRAMHPDLWRVDASTAPLPLETLRTAAVAAHAKLDLRQVIVRAGEGQPVEFRFEKGRHAFVDPGTGALLGTVHREGSFFGVVEDLHTSLAAGPVGTWIVTASTVVLGSLLLTGIFLWWPKQWRLVKGAVALALGRKGRALHFNLHNTLGFWGAIPLFIMCVTGAVMAIKPLGKALESAGSDRGIREVATLTPDGSAPASSIDSIFVAATAAFPDWRELRLHTPRDTQRIYFQKAAAARDGRAMMDDDEPVRDGPEPRLNRSAWRAEGVAGDAAHEHARSKAWFDPRTAALLATDRFADRGLGEQIRGLMRPIHDGSVLGRPTQFLALLGVLMLPILAITGYTLWWLRVRAQRAREKCAAMGLTRTDRRGLGQPATAG